MIAGRLRQEPTTMAATSAEPAGDECFRCGYDLRGITNDRPCPECGLAAERSRRVSDELHETRPKWLRTITAGAFLTLLSILATAAWPFCADMVILALLRWYNNRRWELFLISGFVAAATVFFAGILLLARPEGYPAADHADRWLRRGLRLAALVPLVTLALVCVNLGWSRANDWFIATVLIAGAVGAAPLPLLLFLRLRGLAKRARSAHLAEHCVIVGIGATLAFLCIAAEVLLMMNAEKLAASLGWGPNWETNSTASLVLVLVFDVAICLFLLWSIYLMLRFVIAFARAARQASRKWKRDDHSLPSLSV